MSTLRRMVAAVAVLSAALLLAGCGESEDGSEQLSFSVRQPAAGRQVAQPNAAQFQAEVKAANERRRLEQMGGHPATTGDSGGGAESGRVPVRPHQAEYRAQVYEEQTTPVEVAAAPAVELGAAPAVEVAPNSALEVLAPNAAEVPMPAPVEQFTDKDPVQAMFANELAEAVDLWWADPSTGEEHWQGKVEPSAEAPVGAFHTHTFVVRAGSQAVLRWVADRGQGESQHVHIDRRVSARFANSGSNPIQVYWRSQDGTQEVLQGELAPGQSLDVDTYIGHHFVVKAPDGSVLREWEAAVASPGRQQIEL